MDGRGLGGSYFQNVGLKAMLIAETILVHQNPAWYPTTGEIILLNKLFWSKSTRLAGGMEEGAMLENSGRKQSIYRETNGNFLSMKVFLELQRRSFRSWWWWWMREKLVTREAGGAMMAWPTNSASGLAPVGQWRAGVSPHQG